MNEMTRKSFQDQIGDNAVCTSTAAAHCGFTAASVLERAGFGDATVLLGGALHLDQCWVTVTHLASRTQ